MRDYIYMHKFPDMYQGLYVHHFLWREFFVLGWHLYLLVGQTYEMPSMSVSLEASYKIGVVIYSHGGAL
jgi:hypothetical protein